VPEPDHNPRKRRLHLPIVGVTNDAAGRAEMDRSSAPGRKPPWLKVRLPAGPNVAELRGIMRGLDLHTVCEEAMCPNLGECWDAREATFLLLGSRCTRRCGFCDVMTAKPDAVDQDEPQRIAEAVRAMGLRHVVVTGVARDDLPDGGAAMWAETVRAIRRSTPDCRIEVLPSDFKGGAHDIATVISARPDVFAHNLETVRRLHATIRPAFGYDRSLEVLRMAKRMRPGQVTKSNVILGMGERPDEVAGALRDIAGVGVDIVTIGQYLRPTPYHLPVDRWVAPEEFAMHADDGERLGLHVEAGPLVRSSYHAGEQFRRATASARANA
jgi:lipoyl synthase